MKKFKQSMCIYVLQTRLDSTLVRPDYQKNLKNDQIDY